MHVGIQYDDPLHTDDAVAYRLYALCIVVWEYILLALLCISFVFWRRATVATRVVANYSLYESVSHFLNRCGRRTASASDRTYLRCVSSQRSFRIVQRSATFVIYPLSCVLNPNHRSSSGPTVKHDLLIIDIDEGHANLSLICGGSQLTTAIRFRFDGRSTAIRLLIKGH